MSRSTTAASWAASGGSTSCNPAGSSDDVSAERDKKHLGRRQNPALIAGLPPYGKLEPGAAAGATGRAAVRGVAAPESRGPRDVNCPAGVYPPISVSRGGSSEASGRDRKRQHGVRSRRSSRGLGPALMIPLIIALGAFICVFAGALVGLWLGRNVPEHYRDSPSQEAIQLATGMLSVLAALVLGLLTSSIQSNFDTINTEVNDFAAQLAMLDQTLVDMGPEAAAARQLLRRYTELSIQENWPEESGVAQHGSRSEIVQSFASIFESLRGVAHPMWREGPDTNRLLNSLRLAVAGLPAEGEPAQTLRASAVDLSQTLVEARWTLHERTQNPLVAQLPADPDLLDDGDLPQLRLQRALATPPSSSPSSSLPWRLRPPSICSSKWTFPSKAC